MTPGEISETSRENLVLGITLRAWSFSREEDRVTQRTRLVLRVSGFGLLRGRLESALIQFR